MEDFHVLHKQLINLKSKAYPIDKLKKLLFHHNSRFLTFDRIDSSKGYAINNIVKSCPICNFAKGSFILGDEFRPIAGNIMSRIRSILNE